MSPSHRKRSLDALRALATSLVPRPVRRARRARHRDVVFGRAKKRFLEDPEACIRPGGPVMTDLIYGWGNEGWSGLEEYLVCCVEHALASSAPLLECGSGLSTILVGVIAKRRGYSHWALEHEPEWGNRVQRCLDRYRIDSTVLCASPIKDFGGFAWYDPPMESIPKSFGLVICDGPPGSTKGGRYGLVPVMKDRLGQGCVILLDDAGRTEERAIASRWSAELGSPFKVMGRATSYIKMTLGDRREQVPP
jgi:hypothetical protein